MPTSAIILAAGKSTRMKSRRPKPLHEICGKPMLAYILDACYEAGCEKVMVVVGHGKEEVIAAFKDDSRIVWIEQTQQLGTGHAAKMCSAEIARENGDVFILAGDTPLIRGEILVKLLAAHREANAAASMATALLDDPTGYGRIIRDTNGEFIEIVEQMDCTPAQREIREVFPSYYCVKSQELLKALSQLKNTNAKKEYYLTDIYSIIRQTGNKVLAVQAVTAQDVIAPNTRAQLAEADAAMQARIVRRLCEEGVSIISPANTYIEFDVVVGAETVIHPFTYIGRGARVGSDCIIGPFARIVPGQIVASGETVVNTASLRMVQHQA